jgi:hypothetical protein
MLQNEGELLQFVASYDWLKQIKSLVSFYPTSQLLRNNFSTHIVICTDICMSPFFSLCRKLFFRPLVWLHLQLASRTFSLSLSVSFSTPPAPPAPPPPPLCLSVCLPLCLSVCLSVCVYLCTLKIQSQKYIKASQHPQTSLARALWHSLSGYFQLISQYINLLLKLL